MPRPRCGKGTPLPRLTALKAGLIELSFHFSVDFPSIPGEMRLADAAERVRVQQVHWSSFLEIVAMEPPQAMFAEMGRRFIGERRPHHR